MKRKRFGVEQIVAVLKQTEAGTQVAELIRHVGISEQTPYRWERQLLIDRDAKYSGDWRAFLKEQGVAAARNP